MKRLVVFALASVMAASPVAARSVNDNLAMAAMISAAGKICGFNTRKAVGNLVMEVHYTSNLSYDQIANEILSREPAVRKIFQLARKTDKAQFCKDVARLNRDYQ